MNKKSLLALAVGTVFASPVFAQGSSVEIYGRLYPQLANSKSSGATTGTPPATFVSDTGGNHDSRWSVDTSNSRIGFRGKEQLGGSLSTIWQIETRVRFDTGAGNTWAGGRNSFLGLAGGFGTVKLGNMDTIYKEYGAQVGSFFGVSSGNFVSSSGVLSAHGLGVDDDQVDTGFHFRAPNSIQYETPEFGGFQFGLQYSPDEAKGNPGRDFDSDLVSMGVKYEAGPIYVSVQHERHNDWFDLSANAEALAIGATSSEDQATRLSVGYRFTPSHRITGDIARMEWEDSGPGGSASLEKTSWAIGWEARWSSTFRTEIAYVNNDEGSCDISGAACSTDGLDGKMLSFGAAYYFSKRTFLFGLVSRLTNGDSASFSNTNTFDPETGADTTSFAVGVSHSF